jgi:IS30 family transposase
MTFLCLYEIANFIVLHPAEQILMFADEINAMPRKRLSYQTPEELFDAQLDKIYASNQ